LQKQTRVFFTELSAYQVPLAFYLENEGVFFKLIHNTYDESKLGDSMLSARATTDLFKDVFGQHPNKKNLMKFFAVDVVKYLWENGFKDCKEFQTWKASFQSHSKQEQAKMFKYMTKVSTFAGYNVMKF